MPKNCNNQLKFGQFRNVLLLKTTIPHVDQIKNKPQDLLVNTSSGNQARN